MATRGKPFEPGNKLGRGRPKGSHNKTTLMARALLDEYTEFLVKKTINMAMMGDRTALKLCIERILPPVKDLPVKIRKSLRTRTAEELSAASEAVTQAVLNGKITPSEGMDCTDVLQGRRLVIETVDFDKRLEAVEKRLIEADDRPEQTDISGTPNSKRSDKE